MLAAVTLAGGLTIGVTGTASADVVPPSNTWAEVFDPYTSAPHAWTTPAGPLRSTRHWSFGTATDMTPWGRLSGGPSVELPGSGLTRT
jgi:hypothetical protein